MALYSSSLLHDEPPGICTSYHELSLRSVLEEYCVSYCALFTVTTHAVKWIIRKSVQLYRQRQQRANTLKMCGSTLADDLELDTEVTHRVQSV